MSHNSGSWNQGKEKILLLLREGKEWAVRNKKISIPAAAVVLVALLACVSMFSGKEKTDAAEEESTGKEVELSNITVPEVPLEENAVAVVNELMNDYYAALADGDVEKLEKLKNYVSDPERLRVEKKSEYIEKYENIVCYTKAGLVEDSYLVYAYNEAKFYEIDTPAPALNTFVVFKNEAGDFYIYEGDLDDNTFEYFQGLSAQDDVTNLCNIVQAKYNEAIGEDSQLAEFMDEFPQMIKSEVAKALAEMEQEGTENAENAEASVPEETEQPEETTQEPKAKVTEVETTDTVNVRSSDSETADKIGKAEKGMRLPLLEKKGNGWSKVEFEGKEAFIKSEYLVDIVNVVENGSEEPQTPAAAQEQPEEQTAQEQSNAGSIGLVGKDGKVTAKTTVNVRASANENGERLGVIYQGDKLELVMQQADGWCKVKYNGQTGYVKTEFVE